MTDVAGEKSQIASSHTEVGLQFLTPDLTLPQATHLPSQPQITQL